jgi:hypothetical protein
VYRAYPRTRLLKLGSQPNKILLHNLQHKCKHPLAQVLSAVSGQLEDTLHILSERVLQAASIEHVHSTGLHVLVVQRHGNV